MRINVNAFIGLIKHVKKQNCVVKHAY